MHRPRGDLSQTHRVCSLSSLLDLSWGWTKRAGSLEAPHPSRGGPQARWLSAAEVIPSVSEHGRLFAGSTLAPEVTSLS